MRMTPSTSPRRNGGSVAAHMVVFHDSYMRFCMCIYISLYVFKRVNHCLEIAIGYEVPYTRSCVTGGVGANVYEVN